MNNQTGNTIMNQGAGHKPIQTLVLDQCRRTFPYVDICPRCSVRAQLLLGLKKSPPVCIDCAIDPTWVNPQENWGEGGVVMHHGNEFQGNIGPSRIIIQHQKYTVFEQLHGDKELVVLYNYSRRAYHLPRRNGNALDAAKSQISNASLSEALKSTAQNLGRLEATTKTQKTHQQVLSNPILTTLLLGNQLAKSSQLAVSQKRAKPPGSTIDNICIALQHAKASNGGMDQPGVQKSSSVSMADSTKQTVTINMNVSLRATDKQATLSNFANLNDCRLAHKRNCACHEFSGPHYEANANQMGVDLRNIQQVHNLRSPGMFCCALTNPSQNSAVDLVNNCCVQACGTNWERKQDISEIQCEAMSVRAQRANLPMVGTEVQHVAPLEGAADWRFRISENIYPTESTNQSNHKLSNCCPNSIFCCKMDKQDTLPQLASSTMLNRPPNCVNDWPYNVEQNNITQTDAKSSSCKPSDNLSQTSIFCYNMANPLTLVDPVIHKQQVAPSQAANWTCSTTTQEKQMNRDKLANQNLANCSCRSPNLCCHEFVNPQPMPQCATSEEHVGSQKEAIDLTYDFAKKENHPSTQGRGLLYTYSILNSEPIISESLSTSAVQAKPLEEGLNMAYKMAGQENSTQIEAEKTRTQQGLNKRETHNIVNLPGTKLLSASIEQVKPPEKKSEWANVLVTHEICNQVEIAGNNKVGTQHPRLAASASHVETPPQATILTDKTVFQDMRTPTQPNVDTLANTSRGHLLEFETMEDFLNALNSHTFATPSIASMNIAESNMEQDMGSDDEGVIYLVSSPGLTLQDDTHGIANQKCGPSKEPGKTADCSENGPNLIQNDSSVTLKEQVLNKIVVQDDYTRDTTKHGTMPRIQKARSKQLKERLERRRNRVDYAEFGGKQSVANEREVTEATQSRADMSKGQPEGGQKLDTSISNNDRKCKTSTESITPGGNDQIGLKVHAKRLSDDATDAVSSQIEAKKQNTGQNIQEDTGIMMDCTVDENINELRLHFPSRIDAMTTCQELAVKLFDIAYCHRGQILEDVLGKADQTGQTSHHESSYASKIVELLIRQHEDWRDWRLKIDCESGLVLRNGKSVSGTESWPMDLDSDESVEITHRPRHLSEAHFSASSKENTMSTKKDFKQKLKRQTTDFDQVVAKKPRTKERKIKIRDRKDKGKGPKSAKYLKISQDPKRLRTLQFNKCKSVSDQYQYNKMKSHVRKMYFTESSTTSNQDMEDNITYSVQTKSVQKSSTTSSNKTEMNPKQQDPITAYERKQRTHQQVSKRENRNKHDKSKDGRTRPSVKVPRDPKRQNTIQITKWRPEDFSKSANAKKVRKPGKEYIRHTMERSKQESRPKMEAKKKLPTKMASGQSKKLFPPKKYKKKRHDIKRRPQDPKRQSTIQITKWRPEDFSKSANAKKVRKPGKEYIRHTMERSKRESRPKMEAKKKLPTKMASGQSKKLFPPKKYKKKRHDIKRRPQDPKRQSTIQITKWRPEDFSKSANAKKVRKPGKEYIRHTMERSKRESRPKMEAKKKLPTKMASGQSKKLFPPKKYKKKHQDIKRGPQDPKRQSTLKKKSSVDQDKVNLKEVFKKYSQKTPQYNSAKPKNVERIANVSSNKDYKKGMNSKKIFPFKGYKKKHQPQKKERKGEINNKNYSRWTDRTMPLFDLEMSRISVFRRKRYSKQQNPRQSKSTENFTQMGKDSKDVDYHNIHRTTPPLLIDPNSYHHSLDFTSPDYTAMCEQIDNSIKAFKDLDDQKLTKKPCTITSQDERRDLESQVIGEEIKNNERQESKGDICSDYGKSNGTEINQDLKCKPDCTKPLNASSEREKHSEKQSPSQYQKSKDESYNYPDDIAKRRRLDGSTNEGLHKHERDSKIRCENRNDDNRYKRCRIRHRKRRKNSTTTCPYDCKFLERQRNAKESSSINHQKEGTTNEPTNHTMEEKRTVTRQELPDLKTTEIKDPRIQSRMLRDSEKASNNVPSASMANLAVSRQEERPREKGNLQKNDPVNCDRLIRVFNRNHLRIDPNRKEESIYSWFEFWVQTVPDNRQKSTQKQDVENEKLRKIRALLPGCANMNLVFREWGNVTQSMKKRSLPLLSLMYRNNTLEVNLYKHAVGIWAWVKESSATSKRDKCFIANVRQDAARRNHQEMVRASNRRCHEHRFQDSYYWYERRQYWNGMGERDRMFRRQRYGPPELPFHLDNFSRDQNVMYF